MQKEKAPEIDISKIQNIEELGDEKAIKNLKSSIRRQTKRKFCFVEPTSFPLPSGGRFYQDSNDEDLKKGIIKLYPMSIADEEILTNRAYVKNNSVFRILFDSCMASDYQAKNLLSFDAGFLIYALRKISYGDDYKFDVTCDDCGKKFPFTLNVSDIDFPELKDKEDERTIKLPISKFTVKMHLLRLKDEEEVARLASQYADEEEYNDMVFNLYVRTNSIKDANDEELAESDWLDFYSCLPALDRATITKSFEGSALEPKTKVTCPKCGKIMEMNIPWTPDFFRAS